MLLADLTFACYLGLVHHATLCTRLNPLTIRKMSKSHHKSCILKYIPFESAWSETYRKPQIEKQSSNPHSCYSQILLCMLHRTCTSLDSCTWLNPLTILSEYVQEIILTSYLIAFSGIIFELHIWKINKSSLSLL